MGFTPTEKIWFNGKLVAWGDAKVHVLTHALQYGTGVFEGMRCYATPEGPAVFRLDAHLERMVKSAELYELRIPYSQDTLAEATLDVIRANKLDSAVTLLEETHKLTRAKLGPALPRAGKERCASCRRT